MGYLSADNRYGQFLSGCGPSCSCKTCGPRNAFGEWYVPEEDEPPPAPTPAGPLAGGFGFFAAPPPPRVIPRPAPRPSPPPPPPAPPACAFDIRNAVSIERQYARNTLMLSAEVANRFVRTLGALGARGSFVPTVIDNKYWFAKLYEYITYYEIGESFGAPSPQNPNVVVPRFQYPAFVLHFIPIFYNLYYRALENWFAGNRSAVSSLWTAHFTSAARPDNSSIRSWMNDVRTSIVTGVTAHVQGDMATALERAYRSYIARYCITDAPRFDVFRGDFFERNRIVFDRAKAAFLLNLSQFSPFPVTAEVGQFLFATGEPIAGGLDVDEVYRWRAAAWANVRQRLGQ